MLRQEDKRLLPDGLNRPPDQRIDPKMQTFLTLDDIAVTMKLVLKELRENADKGEELPLTGTATTTMTIIDCLKSDPYVKVKGFEIINDGANDISVSHNNSDTYKRSVVKSGESKTVSFNRPLISKIFISTSSGTSAYRLSLAW